VDWHLSVVLKVVSVEAVAGLAVGKLGGQSGCSSWSVAARQVGRSDWVLAAAAGWDECVLLVIGVGLYRDGAHGRGGGQLCRPWAG